MKLNKVFIFKICFLFFICVRCTFGFSQVYFNFTDEEKQWIKEHPVLTLAPDPDFPPFEYFDVHGNYSGVSANFIKVIETLCGIKFKIVHYDNWAQIIEKFKNKEIDILGALAPTPERMKYMTFTKSYIDVPSVTIVRKGNKVPKDLNSLLKMKLVLGDNNSVTEYFETNYKNLSFERAVNLKTGLQMVSDGKVDVMVANLLTADYFIEKEKLTNLVIGRDLGFIYGLSLGVRKDYSILVSIMNKVIENIRPKERTNSLIPFSSLNKKEIYISNTTLIIVICFLVFLFCFGVYLHIIHLKKTVKEKTKALEFELSNNVKLLDEMYKAKKMEGIGLLAGSVAHDLNNILSGVLTYPDLILMKMEKDNPYRRQIKIVKESAEKAAAIVKDLLTIARSVATERKAISIKNLIREYLNSPEHKELKKRFPNVLISSSFEEDIANVTGSKVHIEKLINNLVMNGMEAIPREKEGVVRITGSNVSFEKPLPNFSHCSSGNYVEIRISDNGTGISEEGKGKIFKPFYSTKVMGKSGTGLGLAVVWNTILNHKGMVTIESDGKSYTDFILYFPSTEEKEDISKKFTSLEPLYGMGQTILIVDDEYTQIEILSDILTTLKYNVLSARSGEEAVRILESKSADLVILDMLMEPGINGRETYEKMLKINPNQKAIVATGMSESKEVEKAFGLGIGKIVIKPYTVEKIGGTVKKILSQPIQTK